MSFIVNHKNGVILKVYIQPGSSLDQICGLFDGRLKIKISSPPVDGEANENIVEFLACFFEIKKSEIEIIRGVQSRKKDILILSSEERIRKKLDFINS